ncbi:MAG: glycosyltransferase [Patescibacteria group bacterium]|nr:glycosyltransferase [Patescibacteria group bacterium]MCL5224433.1 glycosyltransferase [Patescibacteria group bacterium]
MKFSIVVPAYNEEELIGKLIASVKAQVLDRGDSLEMIVVDDNSTDRTAEIAGELLQGFGRVVSESRRGTNFARERGFVESKGDVICFIDADCEIPRDWLANVKRLIGKGYVAVSGPYYYHFNNVGMRIVNWMAMRIVLPILPHVLHLFYRKKAAVVIGGNFAVTREALNAIGGLPPIMFWGDDATTAMLLVRKAGRVAFSHKVWAVTSPRRFYKRGFVKLQERYNKAYFDAYRNTP